MEKDQINSNRAQAFLHKQGLKKRGGFSPEATDVDVRRAGLKKTAKDVGYSALTVGGAVAAFAAGDAILSNAPSAKLNKANEAAAQATAEQSEVNRAVSDFISGKSPEDARMDMQGQADPTSTLSLKASRGQDGKVFLQPNMNPAVPTEPTLPVDQAGTHVK
jgi:hypothetical protein